MKPRNPLSSPSTRRSNGSGSDRPRLIARASAVFNAGQVEGFDAPASQGTTPPADLVRPMARAEALIAATAAEIRTGGDRAYYNRRGDFIQMPERSSFVATATLDPTEAWYGVLLHELIHWTGAAHRLNRCFGERFGDDAYAAEELVAEIGAAFLCAELGVTQTVRLDHAQYIAHWLTLLRKDKRALFTAAARASEAASFLRDSNMTLRTYATRQ